MNSDIIKSEISFVYHFDDDLLKITNLFSKQKMLKLITNNILCYKFLNEKNCDEIGADVEIDFNKDLKVKFLTIFSFHSERLISYSHKVYSINEKNVTFEKIIKMYFYSDSYDNSTLLIIEFENVKKIKEILYNYFEILCKSIKDYNKKNCLSQIILESNVINRPINTIKNNIHIIINIISILLSLEDNGKKNLNIEELNDILNQYTNNNFQISKYQFFNDELEIFLKSNINLKIRISVVALSDISCYIQLMEKIHYSKNGIIVSKISKLNKLVLKLVKEYFEHFIAL